MENEKEETIVEVAPHVYSKPFYELELWSRPSKDSELRCEGKIYSETFRRALELINEWLKEWKYVHGVLKEHSNR